MLDVFYISYNEDFADENYEMLKVFAPLAQRVHGVKGIFQAHKQAAQKAKTSHFYVVDADAVIEEEFKFKFTPSKYKEAYPNVPESECVFTWRSRNPINDLIYGYGAVKLFPKKPFLELTDWSVDMTTSIGCPFVPKFQISNVTAFNTDPFNTWKSAFRECVKLSSNIIDNNDNIDDEYRLKVWCARGEKRQYGEYSILGAQQGADFGNSYRGDKDALKMINDFDWLAKKFDEAV
tara:strand:- start:1693 stop:2397 length:705 start_codon:yes stop_codon:yes gene_type:complete